MKQKTTASPVIAWRTPITHLQGVGPGLARKYAQCGIETIADLCWHIPVRYEDHSRITEITQLQDGMRAVIDGVISYCETTSHKNSRLLCGVQDASGEIALTFFHGNPYHLLKLKVGNRIRAIGEIKRYQWQLQMTHPEYQILEADVPLPSTYTPIYSSTEGLSQNKIRSHIQQALFLVKKGSLIKECFSDKWLHEYHLLAVMTAIEHVHFPPLDYSLEQLNHWQTKAQYRLAFAELVAHHLQLRARQHERLQYGAVTFAKKRSALCVKFIEKLPYTLTAAQTRVIDEIIADLTQATPMDRLVQGDVGAGKTVVAACSVLQVVEQKKQVALMTPTELLTKQHGKTFSEWFLPLGVRVACLYSAMPMREKKKILQEIASGAIDLIIGTHSLIQEQITFCHLAYIIIDEQHRFGVAQREALCLKGVHGGMHPHQLVMTATPIPRTLALLLYADLSQSILDELPRHRLPIQTHVIPETRRNEVIEKIRAVCANQQQVYWVCTLVEESITQKSEAVEKTYQILVHALPELKIALLHGQMKSEDKQQVMQQFQAGDYHILVATTVIEVGIDVSRASLMIIENAERLGLAQLHQLRGRVGRGSVASHCVLLYQSPLTEIAKARLAVMRSSSDGFVIAEKDLHLRGPGELLGIRQAGAWNFRLADPLRDQDLLPKVREIVSRIENEKPEIIAELIGYF